MKSATKLRQEQAEHYAEAKKLNALATAEDTDTDLVGDLVNKVDAAMKLGDDMEAECVEAEEREARMNRIDKLVKEGAKPEINLDEKAPEKRRITIPAAVKRFFPVQNFLPQEIGGMTNDERAFAFGRFFLALAAKKYDHLNKHKIGHIDSFGPMNAATEGGNAGIWVPDQFGTDLIVLMEKYGLARNLLNMVPMTSDKRTDPKEGSDPVPVFVGEGVEGTDVTPTDDSTVTLTARKLMAILINSSELAEDAIVELGDSLMRRMANGFAKKEDQCAFIGDGTSTYGQMVGFLIKLLDVDGAGTNSFGLSSGASGTAAAWSGFTLADFEEQIGLLPDYADSGTEDNPSAVWVCHRKFYYQVMVSLERASGGTPASEVVNGFRRPLFYGWPVRRRAYSVDFSDQATVGSVNLWSSDQVGFKGHERFDINVHSVGTSAVAGPVVGLLSVA
jgi:HK97 family phage major capsid protein